MEKNLTKQPVSYDALLKDEAAKKAFFDRNRHTMNGYIIQMVRRQYHKGGQIFKDARVFCTDKNAIQIYTEHEDLRTSKYTIQTTSWGALTLEELKPYMDAYQRAIDTVKWMEAFDWEAADILLDDVEL